MLACIPSLGELCLDQAAREESLISAGSAAADAVAFDISKVDEIPQFVADVTTKSSDIDCVFLNAGVQRMTDLTSQDKWDEKTFDEVMQVNFTCIVALTRAFLPFLQAQKGPTSFIL
jgi:NADP-dependent 3-hydroxy acid dehydrogenase YdfG